jgi:hypothetical protein
VKEDGRMILYPMVAMLLSPIVMRLEGLDKDPHEVFFYLGVNTSSEFVR